MTVITNQFLGNIVIKALDWTNVVTAFLLGGESLDYQ